MNNKDFNSHAHVERDLAYFVLLLKHHHISTHTLTWSVTDLTLALEYSDSISTHTLTWSVTCTGFVFRACFKNFNSHAHVERDPVI